MRRLLCVLVLPFGAVILTGCLDVAEERAKNEAAIGRRSAHGLAVRSEGGLATVRGLEPGALTLWGQAPSLTLNLTAEVAGEWTLELRNAMPGAVLTGVPNAAVPLALATRKAWRLQLPAGASTVRIATGDAEGLEPWRFAIFADVQDRLNGVQDLFGRMATEPGLRFGLISGDLTNQGDVADLERFQREMETLPFPLFATLGNHELGQGTASPPFHRYFGRGSFSFAFRGARFTLLDAASATIAPRTYDALRGWLKSGRSGLHLAMMHIPPLDPAGFRNGAFASRAEANKLLSLFKRAGVDLTVYGHVHTYHAFTNVGIEAFISGGGGAIPERLDGIGRHFLAVDVRPEEQRFQVGVVRIYPTD
jgi:3',5'-cyclic-AMP phosphodiesterase